MDYTTPTAGELAYGETREMARRIDFLERRVVALERELGELLKILDNYFRAVSK